MDPGIWSQRPRSQPGFANDGLCDFGPIKGSKTPLYMGIIVGRVQGDPVLVKPSLSPHPSQLGH